MKHYFTHFDSLINGYLFLASFAIFFLSHHNEVIMAKIRYYKRYSWLSLKRMYQTGWRGEVVFEVQAKDVMCNGWCGKLLNHKAALIKNEYFLY